MFRIALKAEIIFFCFLEVGVAKWERQEGERPLEKKLKWLGGKKKTVKVNTATLNEPINLSEEGMIMAGMIMA